MADPFMRLLVQQEGFVSNAISAEMRIDLTKSEADLFASLRKKHRQQLRKYCDLTRVSVRTDVDALRELQQLHFQVSGRITRSPLTWKIQEQAITENLAFVVTIRNLSDELLGALYVQYSNYEAISFSAAYNRTAMGKGFPLGHICEWEAIKFLGRNSLAQSYLIGVASWETADNLKLSRINLFKDGFSPTYHLIGHLNYIN
jgi:hypothetical protein